MASLGSGISVLAAVVALVVVSAAAALVAVALLEVGNFQSQLIASMNFQFKLNLSHQT